MTTETLRCCKRLMEALEIETDKLDDLITLETLRRRERLTESQVDMLIELLTRYRDIIIAL